MPLSGLEVDTEISTYVRVQGSGAITRYSSAGEHTSRSIVSWLLALGRTPPPKDCYRKYSHLTILYRRLFSFLFCLIVSLLVGNRLMLLPLVSNSSQPQETGDLPAVAVRTQPSGLRGPEARDRLTLVAISVLRPRRTDSPASSHCWWN